MSLFQHFKNKINNKGDRGQPCLFPFWISCDLVRSPLIITQAFFRCTYGLDSMKNILTKSQIFHNFKQAGPVQIVKRFLATKEINAFALYYVVVNIISSICLFVFFVCLFKINPRWSSWIYSEKIFLACLLELIKIFYSNCSIKKLIYNFFLQG